jgi:hypothetical protein
MAKINKQRVYELLIKSEQLLLQECVNEFNEYEEKQRVLEDDLRQCDELLQEYQTAVREQCSEGAIVNINYYQQFAQGIARQKRERERWQDLLSENSVSLEEKRQAVARVHNKIKVLERRRDEQIQLDVTQNINKEFKQADELVILAGGRDRHD